jgi:hypothetical protein
VLFPPDITLLTQSEAITGWNIDVSSSITDFSLAGTNGVIAVGNDGIFGDRYLATLDSATSSLPMGLTLALFQIDLQGLFTGPSDLLTDGSFASLPYLALANPMQSGGLFSIAGNTGGCQACEIEITSLTGISEMSAVPIPAAVWLFGTALVSVLGFSRRSKTI